jgi:hypothetical protein
MSEFLDACRREWRRLGVPDPVAAEMAAEIAADLEEAEAEGVPPEEVLGSSVFDPAGFAAAWATERGVIPAMPAPIRSGRRWVGLAALACFALITLIGVGVMMLAFGHAEVVAVAHAASPRGLLPQVHGFSRPVGSPDSDLRPVAVALLVVGVAGIALTAVLWSRGGRGGGPRPGSPRLG